MNRRSPDPLDPADMSDAELAVAIQRHRRAALRGSGYLDREAQALEEELRHRAGIISEYGAPLRFAEPKPRRRWWQFW